MKDLCPCCGEWETLLWYTCATCEKNADFYGQTAEDCPECSGEGGGYLCRDCARILGYQGKENDHSKESY